MQNLRLKLDPLSRLRIYNTAKKIVLSQMDRNIISPQRAEEIVRFLQENIVEVTSAEMARKFYESVAREIPELHELPAKFEIGQEEKIDEMVMQISESFISEGELDAASTIASQLKSASTVREKDEFVEKLQAQYPEKFELAVQHMIQNKTKNS